MPIQLNGSTSGSVQVDVPATVSDGDVSLTLPNGVGSANQYLANGSTAGQLAFVTPPGSFTSYAIISDEKSADTHGGTFTSGAFRTRDLNNEIADPDGIVSISSNQFTLGAGSYLISASAPAYQVNAHQTRLYDITNSAVVELGTKESSASSDGTTTQSFVKARVVITGNTVYEIQHRCYSSKSDFGFGPAADFGAVEVYTIVEIFKEA